MGNLVEMRAEAHERFERAVLENSVLDKLWAFCAEMEGLGVTWEVLDLKSDPIEVSIVIGGVGDPSVRAAVEMPAAEEKQVVEHPVAEQPKQKAVALEPAADEFPVHPRPGSVSGAYSAKEIELIHAMLDSGLRQTRIAQALGREVKPVGIKLVTLRKQRKAAAAEPKAVPAVKPAPSAKSARPVKPVPFVRRAGVKALGPRKEQAAGSARADVGERPYVERQLISHLDAVGYANGWSAERDLELVEEIARGASISVVALELRVGVKAVKQRWSELNTNIGDLAHQQRLVSILRERANA